MMLQRLVFAVALGLLATAGGIALTPRVALNTRPQLRFAHAAPAPLGCAPSNFAPSTRCAPPKMQEAAATPAEPAGAVTLTMMLISQRIFKLFGWGIAALVTPTMIALTGGARARH
jgi:hypothetical protein